MSRIAYVNGRYVTHTDAVVHVEDRGYQFADGVYEVIAVVNDALVDEDLHYDRLERSLAELDIMPAVTRRSLRSVIREVVRRNRVRNGIVYLQMTRGVAPRNHAFPKNGAPSSLVITARAQAPGAAAAEAGVSIVSVPDIRWKRCDIKSISLLPNVLAKQAAVEAGAFEAWLVAEDGTVTEGSSTNAWIVTPERALVSRRPDAAILDGITRRSVIKIANGEGYTLEERAFSLDEAKSAAECFLTSTTSWVMPVVEIDGRPVANGAPGTLTRRLLSKYSDYVGSV